MSATRPPSSIAGLNDAGSPSPAAPSPVRAREIAQEFESLLMLQMIQQMRQTFLDEETEGEGFGGRTMRETLDLELARMLARQGGIGLASLLERGMQQQPVNVAVLPDGVRGSDPAPTSVEAAARRPANDVGPPSLGAARRAFARAPHALAALGNPVVDPAVAGGGTRAALPIREGRAEAGPAATRVASAPAAPDLSLPLGSPVSSPFGWRADPFHGVRRFHAGLDFRAAYGREVPTAGEGRVAFAGSQGGYGLTVVVEHRDGVQTRYAHLSSIDVAAGQQLAAGDVVGRVGRTGRATGPHLHFEVAVNGRKVDPALVATRVAGEFKLAVSRDDSSVEQAPAGAPAMGADDED